MMPQAARRRGGRPPARRTHRISRTLRRTIARTATALACLATAAGAQVIHSGTINRAIPNNFTGLFVNVVTGTFYDGPDTFPVCPGPGCGYDFNIFGTSTWSLFAPGSAGQPSPVTAAQRGFVAATASGPASALTLGTLIGDASVFNPGQTVGATELVGGVDRIFGFRFRNEGGNSLHFGWARVRLTNGQPGVLVDYAFNATAGASIAAGDIGRQIVPEPATVVLTATGLGALGIVVRRRRRVA